MSKSKNVYKKKFLAHLFIFIQYEFIIRPLKAYHSRSAVKLHLFCVTSTRYTDSPHITESSTNHPDNSLIAENTQERENPSLRRARSLFQLWSKPALLLSSATQLNFPGATWQGSPHLNPFALWRYTSPYHWHDRYWYSRCSSPNDERPRAAHTSRRAVGKLMYYCAPRPPSPRPGGECRLGGWPAVFRFFFI